MKSPHVKIGTVEMPLNDFVVSRNAILGITKSGKTYTAKGIAEQLLEKKIPIIVFDAIGVWRYLKVPSSGGKGFQVVVAGGSHPDLPLTPQSAPEIVRAAIAQNIPLIIDLYDAKLSKADWRRIVQDCFRILLYENKGLRHIFLEESAEYAPQKVIDGQTYAEVEKLARMGGNASLGITFINQRAQELNKAVLELCDNIILLRQRGTHAIDSLEKQMEKLSPDLAKEVALTMPNMTQGDCWVFTENGDEPTRTRSGKIQSFHPDRRNPDEKQIQKSAVNVNDFVKAMSGKLEKVLEESKANDPTELKRDIARLKKELASKPVQTKEVSILTDADRKLLGRVIEISNESRQSVAKFTDDLCKLESDMEGFLKKGGLRPLPTLEQVQNIYRVQPKKAVTRNPITENSSLGRCERSILTALAQYPAGRSSNQVAILSGYSVNSGGFNNSLSKLRSSDFITRGNPIQITEAGLAALGSYDPLPSGDALIAYWCGKLGKCEREILLHLTEIYPNLSTTEEVAQATGYSANSGGFNNSLSKLRTLELITRGQPISASKDLFE